MKYVEADPEDLERAKSLNRFFNHNSAIKTIKGKYPNHDFVEVKGTDVSRAINWISGGQYGSGTVQHTAYIRLAELYKNYGGFIRLIDKGVLLVKQQDDPFVIVDKANDKTVNLHEVVYYPFEFTDAGSFVLTVKIVNYDRMFEADALETVAKAIFNPQNMSYEIANMNQELLAKHLKKEFHFNMAVPGSAMSMLVEQIKTEFTNITYNSPEWWIQLSSKYLTNLIFTQGLTVLAFHAFAVLHKKHILISKITQERDLKKGDGKKKKRSKSFIFYTYKVELPEGYTPRKFDLNYLVSEWNRRGHIRSVKVLKENVETYEKTKGYKVILGTEQGKYIKMAVPIAPKVVHRRIGNPSEERQDKTYTT